MAVKSAMIRARVEPKLKRDAEKVLAELGLGVSEAITMFYVQIARQRALPFPVALDSLLSANGVTDNPEERTMDLAAVYKRLEELDEWRQFKIDLDRMKLKP